MIRILSSRHLRLATLTLFLVQTSACTTTMHAPLTQTVKAQKITGVTLKSGRKVAFDPPGATIADSAIYANGPSGQVIIPTDSVAEVWTKEVSAAKTIGLVLAIVAVLGVFEYVSRSAGSSVSGGY